MAFLGCARRHRIDPETGVLIPAPGTPNECMDTLPRTRASPEPMGHYRGTKPGRPPEFCATLKLLVASLVRLRNVPPSSTVSKRWPRSFGLRSDAPSRASFPWPATPHRNRVTDPHHSWLGSRLLGISLSSRGYDFDSAHESVAVFSCVAVVRGQSGIARCRASQSPSHYRSRVAVCYGTGAASASTRASGPQI